MSQFKPGDLALVVGGNAFLGNQVEIAQWVEPGDLITHNGIEYELKQDAAGAGWMVICGSQFSVKRPSHLMPLRGDFAPEQQKSREVPA